MFRIARHGTPNRRERSTMKSRLLGRGVVALSLTIGSLMLPAAALRSGFARAFGLRPLPRQSSGRSTSRRRAAPGPW